MRFDLLGFVSVAKEYPHFGVPVFTRENDDNFFVQSIDEEGVVVDFRPIPLIEIQQLSIGNKGKHKGSLEVGSDGHYAFFLDPSEGIFSDRPSVEAYIDANIDHISRSAIANLQALRFIGCSRSEEISAVNRLSRIFENAEVRERFLAVELSRASYGEAAAKIDELIDRLYSSPNFAKTHDILSALSRHKPDFQHRHFRMAIRAVLSNNQVHWISGDADVRDFIKFLIDEGNLRLTEQAKLKLEG